MPKYRDLVEVKMPDGTKKQGVVQWAKDGGLLIYHPIHGNMNWGMTHHETDYKVQGATVRTISDDQADFDLARHRPK